MLSDSKRKPAYFLFTVQIYDASLARRNTNPKKVYCIDHSLVTSVASGVLVNSGHLLENLVFTALRRCHPEVFYYKTKTGKEVDFIVPARRGRSRLLVQVCESFTGPRTRDRETTALVEAMTEQGVESGIIVTRNEEEQIDLEKGIIRVVPAWRFLLELPDLAE
jgi:predicted AAA+ superfamily ATPase